jgi:hypothetical protein
MADIAATLGGITSFIKQARAKVSSEDKEMFDGGEEAGVVVVFLIVYFAIVILTWAAAFYLASFCQEKLLNYIIAFLFPVIYIIVRLITPCKA